MKRRKSYSGSAENADNNEWNNFAGNLLASPRYRERPG
jgi:hypothetical protein